MDTGTHTSALRARAWVFTVNNYSDEDIENIKAYITEHCKYGIFGKEIGPSCGTPHLQGYLYRTNPCTRKHLVKHVASCYWAPAISSPDKNQEYCSKENLYFEHGTPPEQGKRTDLKEIRDEILAGTSVDSITMDRPMLFHQYGRTLNRLEDLHMRTKFRTTMTKGIWYWGPTGVGKSHIAFKGYHPSTHYVYPRDNGWWDNYTQQDTVIFNDFRGEISYSHLLDLVDKWVVDVRRRNRPPLPFTSKTIIITSSQPPEKVYLNVNERDDSITQLLRRFEIIHVSQQSCTEVVVGNNSATTLDPV